MNKTKRKILDKSLDLFNEFGIRETTLRKIALALGISQGNLNYHFKTKDQIIHALYFELVEKMDIEMAKVLQERALLVVIYDSTLTSMKCFYEYKFLMKDLYKVLDASEELSTHYRSLSELRGQQYLFLFEALKAEKLIREEAFQDEYYRLYERMVIVGDNWVNGEGISKLNGNDFVLYSHSLLFELIFPYLTAKGRKEYQAIIASR